jgi:hypothetical protein
MLQRTQMLLGTRRNTAVRRSTRVCITCRNFPLWLERQSLSLLSFVRFSYQFNSVTCSAWKLNKLIFNIFFVLRFSCWSGRYGQWLCSRLCVWNGLPLNTNISMYSIMNRCYNERGYRTNYVRSSIPQCTPMVSAVQWRLPRIFSTVVSDCAVSRYGKAHSDFLTCHKSAHRLHSEG